MDKASYLIKSVLFTVTERLSLGRIYIILWYKSELRITVILILEEEMKR